ncbi:MAG: Mrp/NBP35 family ATP-binding protein [Bacteroidales bacterium]
MNYSHQQILNILRKVKHPETGQDIVSQGMIDDINIEGNKIGFNLIVKKSNDPLISSIKKTCVKAIEEELGKNNVHIRGNINVKVPERKSSKDPKQDEMLPGVKNIVAIASGKGGVGKSTIAANTAVALAKTGVKVGLLDADIFGPSIPKMFNVEDTKPTGKKVDGVERIIPLEKYDVKMLSIGFFVNPEDALIWRGPMATNALKQIIQQGDWGELDYMIIDLPPGTSDIHLTLVQELAVTGAVIVSTPQKIALADALKGIRMFTNDEINVPILGLVENMAWFTPAELPDNKYYIFGKEGCKKLAEKENIPLLGQIPLVQSIMESGEEGKPSAIDESSREGEAFKKMAQKLKEEIEKRNKKIDPTKRVEIKHK